MRRQHRHQKSDHPRTLHHAQPTVARTENSSAKRIANVIEGDAMGSVNKVILVGNLGADPELKYTPSSRPLCNLRIATTEVYKDKSGQRQEKTEWHRVTVWGDQAENCNKYLSKGRSVYIEGRLQTRSYDKEGQKHYATDVVADRVVFLGGGGGEGRGGGGGGGEGRRGGGGGGQGGMTPRDSGPPDDADGGGPPPDDDIPF
jgi:single-strand DNA-binding protein